MHKVKMTAKESKKRHVHRDPFFLAPENGDIKLVKRDGSEKKLHQREERYRVTLTARRSVEKTCAAATLFMTPGKVLVRESM